MRKGLVDEFHLAEIITLCAAHNLPPLAYLFAGRGGAGNENIAGRGLASQYAVSVVDTKEDIRWQNV